MRACRALLKPGGRIAFTTIFASPGLSATDYERARRLRAPGLASRHLPAELLETAGFTAVREYDLTREFLRTTRGWYEHSRRLEAGLRASWGDARYEESRREREKNIAAIEEGLYRRALFVARRT